MPVVCSPLSVVKNRVAHSETIFRHRVHYRSVLMYPSAECRELTAEDSLIDASLNWGPILSGRPALINTTDSGVLHHDIECSRIAEDG